MGHTSFQLSRRAFLRAGLLAGGALALGPQFFRQAFAAGPVTVGPGPYGELQPYDANGIALPPGFSSREVARGGSLVQGSTPPYTWHQATDGQATFATLGTGGGPDGGWILVANSEMPAPAAGGVSAVEFGPDGGVERAYRILTGTAANCAGGPTPWGTWLSCEEHDQGQVWECDPTTLAPVVRPALGTFTHEAVCVDPVGRRLYLTEDKGDGCWYRFTPDSYPDLSAGTLEVAKVAPGPEGTVTWQRVPNPNGGAANPTRNQVAGAARFRGGEGTWYDDGKVYFTTKGDDRMWVFDIAASSLEILYDPTETGPDAPLSGVDNITVAPSGDIYVCEDGRDHDICVITPQFEISRFLTLHPDIHSGPPDGSQFGDNETVGVVFSPDGKRMYFGAQRSFGVAGVEEDPAGVVYEISGPFRRAPGQPPGDGGGGTGGGGGGGAVVGGPRAGDRTPPRVLLSARRRVSIRRFLRHGLPVDLELDEPSGVVAELRIPTPGENETIARGEASAALRDKAALRLEPTARARELLRGRDQVRAKLKVVAADAAGNRTAARRTVTLVR
jgi:uncharacterized protein